MAQAQYNVVALISGGKDSCFNVLKCIEYGHRVVALANLHPAEEGRDELDSFMFQTVGHNVIEGLAQCFDLPLFRRAIRGSSQNQSLSYVPTKEDEVEDLYELLKDVKARMPEVTAVSSGAILSDYQRLRVENVCSRLGLVSLAYLWRCDQPTLLREMIDAGLHAVLIKVAAMGLDPRRHLGKSLAEMYPELCRLRARYGCNECGEGGEYETLVLDSPVFRRRLVIEEAETISHSDDAFAPVAFLRIRRFRLEEKEGYTPLPPPLPPAAPSAPAPPAPPPPAEAPPSPAPIRVARAGYPPRELLHVAGIASEGGTGPSASPGEETRRLLARLEAALGGYGASLSDAYFVRLYVRRMADFAAVNAAYAPFFPSSPPSRSCVEAPIDCALRLECLAVRGGGGGGEEGEARRALHVQSVSRWASACIGPYSQANVVGSTVHLSGVLGLVPETMLLEAGGAGPQAARALRNAARVLEALGSGVARLVSCVAFVADRGAAAREQVRAAVDAVLEEEGLSPGSAATAAWAWVEVPALPRGALVELELTAAAGDGRVGEPVRVSASSSSSSGAGAAAGPLQTRSAACAAGGASGAAFVTLSSPPAGPAPVPPPSPAALAAALAGALAALRGPLASALAPPPPEGDDAPPPVPPTAELTSARLFYLPGALGPDLDRAALFLELEGALGGPVALAPARALERPGDLCCLNAAFAPVSR
eukprot:tig00020849_g14664.t1